MNERSLVKISVLCFLSGFLTLFYAYSTLSDVSRPIGEATLDYTGESMVLCGDISDMSRSDAGHLFFTLSDGTGSIKAVAFNSSQVSGISDDRTTICIKGVIDVYKDELEIIAKEEVWDDA